MNNTLSMRKRLVISLYSCTDDGGGGDEGLSSGVNLFVNVVLIN